MLIWYINSCHIAWAEVLFNTNKHGNDIKWHTWSDARWDIRWRSTVIGIEERWWNEVDHVVDMKWITVDDEMKNKGWMISDESREWCELKQDGWYQIKHIGSMNRSRVDDIKLGTCVIWSAG